MYSNVLALWKYILPHNSWIWGEGQEIGKNLKTTQEDTQKKKNWAKEFGHLNKEKNCQ